MTAQNQEKPQFDQGAIIKALQNALRTTSSKIGQMNEVLDIVRLGGEGFMAIKSRPDYVYRFRTTLMNPTASVKDQENTFAVRGEFVRATPP